MPAADPKIERQKIYLKNHPKTHRDINVCSNVDENKAGGSSQHDFNILMVEQDNQLDKKFGK